MQNGWTPVTIADVPNPIIATRKTSDGGTARLYRNGMVDAVDGQVYSLSMGFPSFEALQAWITAQHRKLNP